MVFTMSLAQFGFFVSLGISALSLIAGSSNVGSNTSNLCRTAGSANIFFDHLLAVSISSHQHQDQRDIVKALVVVLVFPVFLTSLLSTVLVFPASLLS